MKKLLLCLSFLLPSLIYPTHWTIFAHGIVDGPTQIQRFQEAIATPQIIALEFPDSQRASGWGLNGTLGQITHLLGKKVNRNAMFMGQGADIETISKTINQIPSTDSIVLYGCSRGSAAILTYLSIHNPPNIAALVLDACPANLPDLLHVKLAQLGIIQSNANSIFTALFPQYNHTTAITPEMAIQKIQNKKLPILLIHSECDSIVHHSHSLRLNQKLVQVGFTNVHLALVPLGRHSFLLQNVIIKPAYLTAVHSFYKKYNLPHDSTWAQPEIALSNLSQEAINQQIKDYQRSIRLAYLKAFKRNVTITASLIFILTFYLYPGPLPLQLIKQSIVREG